MALRTTRVIVTITVLLAARSVPCAESVVEYRDDKLTAHVSRMSVEQMLNRVASATGATIRGRLEDEGDVSADFDALPVQEAMRRLLPRQGFALRYEGERLVAIELVDAKGVVQPPPAPAVIRRPGQTAEDAAVEAALASAALARQTGMASDDPTILERILAPAPATPETP